MVALSPPAATGLASDLGGPLSALQIRVFLLCALIVLLDGYDLQAMALAVPTLARQWQLVPAAGINPVLGSSAASESCSANITVSDVSFY